MVFFISKNILLRFINLLYPTLLVPSFVFCKDGENKSKSKEGKDKSSENSTEYKEKSSDGTKDESSQGSEDENTDDELSNLVKQHLRISKDIKDIQKELQDWDEKKGDWEYLEDELERLKEGKKLYQDEIREAKENKDAKRDPMLVDSPINNKRKELSEEDSVDLSKRHKSSNNNDDNDDNDGKGGGSTFGGSSSAGYPEGGKSSTGSDSKKDRIGEILAGIGGVLGNFGDFYIIKSRFKVIYVNIFHVIHKFLYPPLDLSFCITYFFRFNHGCFVSSMELGHIVYCTGGSEGKGKRKASTEVDEGTNKKMVPEGGIAEVSANSNKNLNLKKLEVVNERMNETAQELQSVKKDLKDVRHTVNIDDHLVEDQKDKNNAMQEIKKKYPVFFDEDSGNSTDREGLDQVKNYLEEDLVSLQKKHDFLATQSKKYQAILDWYNNNNGKGSGSGSSSDLGGGTSSGTNDPGGDSSGNSGPSESSASFLDLVSLFALYFLGFLGDIINFVIDCFL